jgi:crotonobetainyl-CoA:carnitine CoA-transferase CaiB-like acyl-CoA transferase
LSRRLRKETAAYWSRALNENGVPASPVYEIADVVRDPQIMHRGLFKFRKSEIPELVSPIRFVKENKVFSNPAPRVGQNTREVLQELGYSKSSIKKLADNKAI